MAVAALAMKMAMAMMMMIYAKINIIGHTYMNIYIYIIEGYD